MNAITNRKQSCLIPFVPQELPDFSPTVRFIKRTIVAASVSSSTAYNLTYLAAYLLHFVSGSSFLYKISSYYGH